MDLANTLRTVYKASDLIAWQSQGALDLSPFFQRRPVWQPGAKSYLIDTIIRGFPIPSLIFRDKPTKLSSLISSREVVDGQQRLRTLFAFVAPSLLKDWDPKRDDFRISRAHNPDLSGLRYSDLESEIRQRIMDYQFTAHIFPAEADDRDILEIFARMNATGVKLNAQELRNAEYFGFFKTQAFSLANEQLARWRDQRIFTDAQLGRMAEVEFTSELLIIIDSGISEGSNATINRCYKKYDEDYPNRDLIASRFREVMETIDSQIDFDTTPRMRNRTLYYCLFAAIYDTHFGLHLPVKRRPTKAAITSAVSTIQTRALRLSNESAPPVIQKMTERRMTHAKERRAVTHYLLNGK